MNVLLLIGLFEIVVIAQKRDGYDIVNNYSSGPSTTQMASTFGPSTTQMSSTTSKKTRPTKKTKTTTVMDIIYTNTNTECL